MKPTHTLKYTGSLLVSACLLNSTANAALTISDLSENFEASSVGNTVSLWDNTVGSTDLSDIGDPQTLVSVSSATYNIDTTYRFDGTGGFTSDGTNIFSSPLSGSIASFEFWIRPVSLDTSSMLLFESGGGTGLTFSIDAAQNLTLGSSGSASNLNYDLTSNSAYNGLDGLNDFIQVLATFDGVNATLYIDGSSVDSTAHAGAFNGSGNDDGLAFSNTDHGGIAPDAIRAFQGDIAIMRIYDDALTAAEVLDNYNALAVPEPSSTALLGLGGIALILRRRRK